MSRVFYTAAFFLAMFSMTAVSGFAQTGATVAQEQTEAANKLPPVFNNVEKPTAVNEDGTAAVTAPDPCAAYLGNFNNYTICQDRMQKIQKMRDGQKNRLKKHSKQQPAVQKAPETPKAADEKPAEPDTAADQKTDTEEKTEDKKNAEETSDDKPETKDADEKK